MADRDRHPPGAPASESVVHLGDLLDSAAVRLPEDHPGYPTQLRLVFFEWFSSLRHAARLRRAGKNREAAMEAVRAAFQFLARFESGTDADLTAYS
jgi:hypothetical protein